MWALNLFSHLYLSFTGKPYQNHTKRMLYSFYPILSLNAEIGPGDIFYNQSSCLEFFLSINVEQTLSNTL